MPTYDGGTAECLVYTFKDGLLARMAHDLRLRLEEFRVTVDEAQRAVQASFDTRSVHVVCFRKDGRDDSSPLGAFERRQIEGNVHDDVLCSSRFPEARFISTEVSAGDDSFTVAGTLTLHGRSAPIAAQVRRQGERYLATVHLRQSDFGIKPYSAALGALKVRDEVTVTLAIPVPRSTAA